MSLDKEALLPHEVSPAFPAIGLSEQPTKPRPLHNKNGLQLSSNHQDPIACALPVQQIAKRRYSMSVGFKGLAKRRRRAISDNQLEPVLPSHFLLGGNIFDPLNLNSLMDEDVNRYVSPSLINRLVGGSVRRKHYRLPPQGDQSGDAKVLAPADEGRRPRRDPGSSGHHRPPQP